MEGIKTQLSKLMETKELEEADVAKLAKVSKTTVQNWLKGNDVSLKNLNNLLTAIGLTFDEFLQEKFTGVDLPSKVVDKGAKKAKPTKGELTDLNRELYRLVEIQSRILEEQRKEIEKLTRASDS